MTNESGALIRGDGLVVRVSVGFSVAGATGRPIVDSANQVRESNESNNEFGLSPWAAGP